VPLPLPSRVARPRRGRLALVLALFVALPALTGARYSARVVRVIDGDTVTVLREHDGKKTEVKVRLYGIDAPEKRQAFGTKSKQALSALVFRKVVEVDSVDTDHWGRTVARLLADDRDVNVEMVSTGFAWHFLRYSHDADLAAAERDARGAHRGLWSDPAARPPWEFRKRVRGGEGAAAR
jgi:micrococcal nuclease